MTFVESLERALSLKKYAKRYALVDHFSKLTFEQVGEATDKTSRWLKHKGCTRGDRIAALTFSCAQAIVLEWATYKLGGIWIGVPWRERRPEIIVSMLKACSPRLFFLDQAALDSLDLDFLLKSSDLKLKKEGKLGHLGCFRPSLETQSQNISFKIADEDIVRIRFTSGASGQPKGIIYTQQTQEAILNNISQKVIQARREVMIHGAPIAWASGSLIAPVLCNGGCNVLRPKWVTEDFVEAVWREQCTLTFLAPKMLSSLVEYSDRFGSQWAKSLRRVIVAGAPTPVVTMQRAKEFFRDTHFYTTLGMTEASFPITWHKVYPSDVNQRNRRPYVPLGSLTSFYKKSRIDDSKSGRANCGELLVEGLGKSNTVASGKWIWLDDNGKPLKNPRAEKLESPYKSGDMVEREGRILHYLCRKDESCVDQNISIAVDAIETLLCDCEGVNEARIDRIVREGKRMRVDVTIKAASEVVEEMKIRSFFKRNASQANLRQIEIGEISFGTVEKTASGKIIHNKSLCPGSFRGGLGTKDVLDWKEFVFSQLQSGPLYFYVGAGLSMAAGLVGWGEMASLVWRYLKHYERKRPIRTCPPDVGKENAEFLDEFVTQGNNPIKILSHDSKNPRALGRTVLLNLILRYRAPKTILDTKGRKRPYPMVDEDRTRWGREPNAEDLVLQSLIWRTHCHGVLTSNYDMLLEHAFSIFNHGAALRSYRYNADFLRYIMSNPQFVLKLHGDINDIGRMQLDPKKAWQKNKMFAPYREDLKETYSTALQNGHMIYIGMGFRDETIIRLHKAWRSKNQTSPNLRVALVPYWDLKEIKKGLGARQKLFDDVLFLTYGGESEDSIARAHAVRELLSQIVHARSSHIRAERRPCQEATDIHHQVFLSSPSEQLARRLWTELWTCKGMPVRHKKTGY